MITKSLIKQLNAIEGRNQKRELLNRPELENLHLIPFKDAYSYFSRVLADVTHKKHQQFKEAQDKGMANLLEVCPDLD